MINEMELGFSGHCPTVILADIYAQAFDLYHAGKKEEAFAMFGRIQALRHDEFEHGQSDDGGAGHVQADDPIAQRPAWAGGGGGGGAAAEPDGVALPAAAVEVVPLDVAAPAAPEVLAAHPLPPPDHPPKKWRPSARPWIRISSLTCAVISYNLQVFSRPAHTNPISTPEIDGLVQLCRDLGISIHIGEYVFSIYDYAEKLTAMPGTKC